ncbi:MAG: ATPase [Gammaproteobacteria bacterium]|nr:ATPase [Gammaproteobacteria bacterium]
MQRVKAKLIICLGLFLSCLSFSSLSNAQNLDEAKAACNDLTAANREMAKAAGYDIDNLCNSLKSVDSGVTKVDETPLPQTGRETVSSEDSNFLKEPTIGVQQKEAIRPFGYDIFANMPGSFSAPTNIAVPPNYLLGPGDELAVIFYGKLNQSSVVKINRDGLVDFPELGPMVVAGLTFSEAENMLQKQIESQVIGTKASISMGTLRSMQVFVLGEAFKPGAYLVSSLSTVTHALISAGGVSDIASLRNIQLKRAGKIVATLDLYDLLLSGEVKDDLRLQAADVIFIPTIGKTVSVGGEVIRPAIYELNTEKTVQEVLSLAGGLSPKAFAKSAKIERVGFDGFMTVVNIDASSKQGKRTNIKSGDVLIVDSVVKDKIDTVIVDGFIHYTIEQKWTDGLTLSDLVYSKDQFPSQLDLNYGLIVREAKQLDELEVLSFKPKDLLSQSTQSTQSEPIELFPRDQVFFFSKANDSRKAIIEPLTSRLSSQALLDQPAQLIEINGAVKFPGTYPLTAEMSVKDLINAAGGLNESAYLGKIEINRQDHSNPEQSVSETINTVIAGHILLQRQDSVLVRATPNYFTKNSISLMGEIMFPGEYYFSKGESLLSVIERAGGFTDEADVKAAVFSREKLKLREQKELDRLKDKLDKESTNQNLIDANSGDVIDDQQQQLLDNLIADLNAVQATGRLVIPLQKIISGDAIDIILETGDVLAVPPLRQEVSVIGEVQRPISYFFDKDLDYNDYIEKSGGLLPTADAKGVYIVKSSGEVSVIKRYLLIGKRRAGMMIEPGDTIVVPLDKDDKRFEGIKLFSQVTQIIYQLSLGIVAVDSLTD